MNEAKFKTILKENLFRLKKTHPYNVPERPVEPSQSPVKAQTGRQFKICGKT